LYEAYVPCFPISHADTSEATKIAFGCECRRGPRIMIVMLGIVGMEDLQRRLGGGSMTTKYEGPRQISVIACFMTSD